ncbi:MAG TPA: LamG domain-containing protein [Planctomycetota bacterium]|nr:LamG domain-containing protein [Planctomycetota bacterium]
MGMVLALVCALAQSQRAPAPDPQVQKEKEKVIREVFKAEYAAKTSAERAALARTLLQQGIETKDDLVTQYVMLREARDVAVSVGDAATAADAIAELSRVFEVDPLRMKLSVLSSMAQDARTTDAARLAAEALLKLVDEAETAEEIEIEEKAAALAVTTARRAKDVPFTARSEARVREVSELKPKLARVKAARETLQSHPDDPAANLTVGLIECFYRGDWEIGLPHLAKGGNEVLKALALKDLSRPEQLEDQVALGDGWKERFEKEPGSRPRIRERAVFWYEKAVAHAGGLQRMRIEKTLSDLAGPRGREVAPEGLVGWWKLDEGAGSQAEDASGHQSPGRLMGGADWGAGHLGKALHLDGRDGHLSVPDSASLRLTGDLTIAFWFRKDQVPNDWARLVGKGDLNNRNYGVFLGASFHQDHLLFQQWDASKKAVTEVNGKFHTELGKWYHVAAVAKGEDASLYIDGKLDMTLKRKGVPATSADPLILGYPGSMRPFAGMLDDVRIYERALTESEIQALASMK